MLSHARRSVASHGVGRGDNGGVYLPALSIDVGTLYEAKAEAQRSSRTAPLSLGRFRSILWLKA